MQVPAEIMLKMEMMKTRAFKTMTTTRTKVKTFEMTPMKLMKTFKTMTTTTT